MRDWRPRHRVILWLLWLHVAGIFVFGLIVNAGVLHSLIEASAVAVWAVVANSARLGRRTRSAAASFGLLTASALVVHLADGAIEAHFHFFVVIAVIALYQDWVPFLVAISFVVAEHGLVAVILPAAVYDHADAWADPWKWALIHGSFILAASVAHVAQWRLSELTQADRRQTQETQSRLAAIVTSSDEAIVSTSPAGSVTSWNTGAERWFGYTAAEMLGQPMTLVVPDDQRARTGTLKTRLMHAGRIENFETQGLRKDGILVDISASLGSIHDASGKPIGTAIIAHDTTERRQAQAALAHQAHYDPLTDLPNRTLLYKDLRAALGNSIQSGYSLGLLMLDLDRFKEVNDTLGHQVGDLLLQQISKRLQGAVRVGDLVARLGGDEFAVLLPATDAAAARGVAEMLAHALQTPFLLDGQAFAGEASIGIAIAPDDGQDADMLLRCADVAMYRAKHAGTGVASYCAAEDEHRPDRLALLGELRHAIEHDELLLHYQPKLNLRDGSLVGVEALVRWQHPQRGFLSPGEFVPVAEQSGLIHPLSLWVLDAALLQQQSWRKRGLHIPVAVNLSRRMLHDPGLPDTVAQLLGRWEVPASALVLEITESGLMADPLRAGENLTRLRALGVLVSIDDFGTGYSSLASLKNLSVDELKIDQSFVQAMATDASSRAIVRAIIDLADALKLRVVAEGVEDRATWDLLVGLGCDVAQGYFLSRPIGAGMLEDWIAGVGQLWLAIAEHSQTEDPLQDRIRSRGARLTAEEEFIARKLAEAALWASDERNRLALQAARMGTWNWDAISNVHTWSSETEVLFGLTPGSIDGDLETFKSVLHPDEWASLSQVWETAVAERRDFTAAYRVIWPDGSLHWIEDNGRGRYATDGTLLRVTGTSMDVTDRKRTEEALGASEERNRLALQAAGMGSWDADVLSHEQIWSVETQALHGLAPGTFEGTLAALKRTVHPDDWPAFEAEMQGLVAERRDSMVTYRTVWPDGSIHWLENKARGMYGPDGSLLRITGTSLDITNRKRTEAALRASEERNRLALEAAHMGTFDRDPLRGEALSWSPEMEALHGVARGTFGGTFAALESCVHPDDWPAFEAEIHASEAEHRETHATYRVLWADGSEHWLEAKGRAQYGADGSIVRVSGTTMDITERKQAEEALRASEERFRKQYKSVPVPTYSWLQMADDFVLQDVNDAAEALGEGNAGALIGSLASERYARYPELPADMHACLTEQRMLRRELHFKYPSSGRERELALSYVFVPPATVMIHSEDITELRRAEQQREAMVQSEKLRALGQMASGVAHDLNQSLMLVASYNDLARHALGQRPLDLAEVDDLLATATQGAMDGGETVKRLLQFTRTAPVQAHKRVDLSAVIQDAARLTTPRWRDLTQAEGRPITLHVDAEEHPTINGSESQLRELLTNLIFNAVDALPLGGTIRLRVAIENGQGVIEVADSGIGMSVEIQRRVFEPFFTTKGDSGTGLGLAMVFGIVEQHGGQIEVRSAPGDGTMFRITLPLASEVAPTQISAKGSAQPLHALPLRILAVDDEPMMTRAMVRMLRPFGHMVVVAASGEEALIRLNEHTFDVVVSDMGMGAGMNGWELADAVRRRWPGVRFFLATGWGASVDPGEARTRGVEAVLSKPYRAGDLLQALQRTNLAA